MCIFSQPVESVTDTNIFARLIGDGWQYVVYQMNFMSRKSNAIILPLPVAVPAAEDQALTFVSLKGYEDFFRDMESGFPISLPTRGSLRSKDADLAPDSLIEVHEVGDFVASFVPTQKDFTRLDPQFRIAQESWDKIPRYGDYGFAVFQLKSKVGRPHPMAFRFKTRQRDSVFFPTVHIHDGEVHKREEFDHTLYLQAPEFDLACGHYQKRGYHMTDKATGYVRSKWPAKQFCRIPATKGIVAPDQLVHRLEKKGVFRNEDILAHLNMSHASMNPGAGSLGSSIARLAGTTGVASLIGFKWLCNRRDLVAAEVSDVEPQS